MTKKTMIVNVDREGWLTLREAFPKTTDSKRSRILLENFDIPSFKAKLQPEHNDGPMDIKMKKILKGLI